MPIDRGPFNALVDDDGSNTTGTIWQKTAIQISLLDPIDSAIWETQISSTVTGTQNGWTPGLGTYTYIRWTGMADLTVNGLVGATRAGQRVTLQNLGAATIYVGHLQTGVAPVGTRFQNLVTSGPTPIGLGGWATWIFDGGTWVLLGHEQGAWLTPPFLATNFTANTGAWAVASGNVSTNKYRLSGRQLIWQIQLLNSSVSSGPNTLFIAMPNSWVASSSTVYHLGGAWVLDGGGAKLGMLSIGLYAFNHLEISKFDSSIYVAGFVTAIAGTGTMELS